VKGPVNREKALAAWAPLPPEWVKKLADACDATSQRIVADKIGLSSGAVSRVINHTYAAGYDEIERKVMSRLVEARVDCPAVGASIALKTCIRNRRATHTPTSMGAHVFARACPTCRFNTDKHEKERT